VPDIVLAEAPPDERDAGKDDAVLRAVHWTAETPFLSKRVPGSPTTSAKMNTQFKAADYTGPWKDILRLHDDVAVLYPHEPTHYCVHCGTTLKCYWSKMMRTADGKNVRDSKGSWMKKYAANHLLSCPAVEASKKKKLLAMETAKAETSAFAHLQRAFGNPHPLKMKDGGVKFALAGGIECCPREELRTAIARAVLFCRTALPDSFVEDTFFRDVVSKAYWAGHAAGTRVDHDRKQSGKQRKDDGKVPTLSRKQMGAYATSEFEAMRGMTLFFSRFLLEHSQGATT
jgi:hypothetical protein